MYFIGIGLYIIAVVCGMFFKGIPYSIFYNPSVIVMNILGILAAIVSTSDFKTFALGFKLAARKDVELSRADKKRVSALFASLIKTSVAIAVIGAVFSIIAGLSHIDDFYGSIHAASAGLIFCVYAAVLSMVVFEPIRRKAKK